VAETPPSVPSAESAAPLPPPPPPEPELHPPERARDRGLHHRALRVMITIGRRSAFEYEHVHEDEDVHEYEYE